ncbi:MAG: hypothetical protein K2M55_07510, partial [Muribaculaceae bacterium]|nr:hypothetical protein [Muribaculaceae bacterium]
IQDTILDLRGPPIPAGDLELPLENTDFTFRYEVGFAPAIDMKLDDSVELDFYNIAVSDEMVEEQTKALLNQAGEQGPADTFEERALVKGEIKQLDAEGNVLEGGITVEDGILAPFTFTNKEEAAKFEGKKVADCVVFNPFETCNGNEAEISSMLHINRDDVEKAKGNFAITIKEFIVHRPAELGQAFYDKVFGADQVHNEEEFRQKVVEMIEAALQPNSQQLFTRTAEDYLMATYGENMPLPMEFLKKFMARTNPELAADAVAPTLEQSIPGLKWEIIENKAAEKLEVKLTEDDVKAFAHDLAIAQLRQYGMAHMADQMADYLAQNILQDKNQRQQVVRQAFNSKLFAAIHNAVKLNEKTVSLDEFRAMVQALNNASGAEVAAEEETPAE